MKIVRAVYFAGFAAAVFLVGCGRQQQQFETIERICAANLDKAEAMNVAEEVLGELHFAVAKADAEDGYIRTRPLRGGQWFEFWRKDNVGAENAVQANLQSIRRIAELDIKEENGKLCVVCNVSVQRLSLDEREVSSSTRAYRMFSESSMSKQELRLYSKEKAWVDLGKDDKLATEILKRLKEKIAETPKDR